MTNLEAIKSKVSYPLSDNTYLLVLLDNGLTSTATYDTDSDKRSMDLAQADLIYILCTQANLTEGGFAIKIVDRAALMKVADGIYNKYGVFRKPTAKFVSKW